MAIPANEPTTVQAVQDWVDIHNRAKDRFAHVAAKYDGHRVEHGCYDVYPYPNGALLGTLAASHRAQRIVEVGGGLGYSALWLAYGAGAGCRVESVECNAEHAAIARQHFNAESLSERIEILPGTGASMLPTLKSGAYDLAYFDTDPAESIIDLEEFHRLLAPGGLLISANLFLAQYAPDLPGLDKTAAYREEIFDGKRWLTTFLSDGTALSIKR